MDNQTELTELATQLYQALDRLGTFMAQALDERDHLRAALLTLRRGITEATAYPETVAWTRRVIDGVLKEEL
jgi:hypothetical protein